MLTTNLGNSTTIFVGNHYEVTDGVVTKYYFAGAQRIAMRTNGTLTYLFSDHLGSTSLTTDSSGNLISQMKYKAWGEVRSSTGTTPTDYTYTGQYSHTADFGLMFYNARWYDPSLGRFAQADSIIPDGVQGLDRYAYGLNNPTRYTDPSGHCPVCIIAIGTGLALISLAMSIDQANFGADEYNWASQQPGLASEQQAAQQWQDNCMGQCHYAHTAESTPSATVGGERPATPIGDVLVDGAWNMTQATIGVVGSAIDIGMAGAATNRLMSFNNKGSMFLTLDEFNSFGDSYGGHNGYTFITSPVGGDIVENASSLEKMGRLLGRDFPSGSTVYRIDIDDIAVHNARMPFAGNEHWIPGGITRGGLPERIIDPIDLRSLNHRPVFPN